MPSFRTSLTLALLAFPLTTLSCLGAPGHKGPVTPHFDGTRFHNLPPGPQPTFADVLHWQLTADPIPWCAPPPVTPARPPARVESGIHITFVNHATALIQLDGVAILTDPVWSDRVGPFSGFVGPARQADPGVRFEDLPSIDAVLVSHSHYDHCDVPTLRALEGRFGMPIFAGLGSREMLAEHDVYGGVDLDWWQSAPIGNSDVTITMTPARHGSQRGFGDRNTVLWGGFVVKGPSGTVFFAGDTASGPHFVEIKKKLGAPTVALLPIGAYLPRWFMKSVHMDPTDAVRAHEELGAKHSIGIHWGTFNQSDEGRFQPAGELMLALRAAGIPEKHFVAAKNGESFTFDAPTQTAKGEPR